MATRIFPRVDSGETDRSDWRHMFDTGLESRLAAVGSLRGLFGAKLWAELRVGSERLTCQALALPHKPWSSESDALALESSAAFPTP